MCIEDFTFQKNRIYFPINHARVVFNISNYYQSFSSINSGQPEMQNEFLFFRKKIEDRAHCTHSSSAHFYGLKTTILFNIAAIHVWKVAIWKMKHVVGVKWTNRAHGE